MGLLDGNVALVTAAGRASDARRRCCSPAEGAAVGWGGAVHLIGGPTPAASLTRDGAWTPGDLLARQEELLAGRSSGIPAFPFGS